MMKQELEACLSRVAVAMDHRADSFRVTAAPFGNRFAVFVDAHFNLRFLEVADRGNDESEAYELAWFKVCVILHDEEKRLTQKVGDARGTLARAEFSLGAFRKALLVEKDRPSGAFIGGKFVPGDKR